MPRKHTSKPRHRVNARRLRRKLPARLVAEGQFMSVISPASSAVIGWNMVPDAAHSSTFRLTNATVTGTALDAATANSLQTGPAFIQMRQIAPDGKTTLRSSTIKQFGANPRSYQLRTDSVEYPGPWRGDALFAVDCLCPKKSYEIGCAMTISLTFTYDHEPNSEHCPTIEATPTLTLDSMSISV